MKNSDDLFQLIKSLSKSEKRYFKLSASIQKGAKNYLRLFDTIDAQSTYDEDALKKQFDGEQFIRQFNVAKRYLHHLVMKSLRSFHARSDTSLRTKELLRNAEILFEKRLERQARNAIEKAVQLATEQEDMIVLMEILAWKQRINGQAMVSEEAVAERYEDQFRVIDQYRNMLEYARQLDTIAVPTLRNDVRMSEHTSQLNKARSLPLGEEQALSVKARLLYNWAQSMSYFNANLLPTALHYTMRQIELFEENPIILQDHPTKYISVLNNAMMMQMMMGDDRKAEETMAKTEEVAGRFLEDNRLKTLRLRSTVFLVLNLNRVRSFILAGEFAKGVALAGTIDTGLETYAELIGHGYHVTFNYSLARVFFGIGDYGSALDRINRVLNGPEPSINRGHYDHARILAMVIHTELGNIELLEYLARSAYRYFHSRERMGTFESLMITFFRRLPRIETPSRLIAAFTSLRNDLLALEDDPIESDALHYFHYTSWIESRIENRPFADIVREGFKWKNDAQQWDAAA